MSFAAQPGPFTGPIFEIVAGSQDKTTLHAHASVLEKSPKLKAQIEGNWKDSTEQRIELQDWDGVTVARFIEWLYSGGYSYPCPSSAKSDSGESLSQENVISKSPEIAQKNTAASADDLRTEDPSRPLTPLGSIHFKQTGFERKFDALEPCRPRPETGGNARHLSFQSVFLAHARVYALADYLLLPRLQAFAFDSLQEIFRLIGPLIPNTLMISDLVSLVEYVYSNTVKPQDYEEPLRKLVTTSTATDFGNFRGEGGAVERLMDEGGAFAVDVYEKVRRNTRVLREKIENLKREVSKLKAEKSRKKASGGLMSF